MTGITPRAEEILEQLVRLADGDDQLVQRAFVRAAQEAVGQPPSLEAIVEHILKERRGRPAPTAR